MPSKKNTPFALGRRHDPDARDHEYLMAARLPRKAQNLPVSKSWPIDPVVLDQGPTSACVGHACRNFLRCAPVRTKAPHPSQWDIYRGAVLLDPFADNDDEAKLPDGDPGMDSGTTVRAGMKYLASQDLVESYHWAFSLQPAIEWLLTKGPLVIGVNWYDSMFEPDSSGHISIAPGAKIVGGHSVLLRTCNQRTALVGGPNNWGKRWAKLGSFTLSFKDLERLIREDGEVCAAIQKAAKKVARKITARAA
jgi:hypothetical protein